MWTKLLVSVKAAVLPTVFQQTSDPQSKRSLLGMARAWLALVGQGEKNSDAATAGLRDAGTAPAGRAAATTAAA
jgi:hypothetical protein